jgi:hypothetical protein
MYRVVLVFLLLLVVVPMRSVAQAHKVDVFTMTWSTQGDTSIPMLSVTLKDDQEYLFVFDTGMQTTLMDRSFAKSLKLPIKTYTVENSKETYDVVFCPANLGPGILPLKDAPFTLTDLTTIRQFYPKIVGVLGMNFLPNFAFRMDYSKKQLDLLLLDKVAGTEYEPKGAFRIPLIKTEDESYNVEATLDGKPLQMNLDTGAENSFLGISEIIAFKPIATLDGFQDAMMTESGARIKAVPTRFARFRSLTVSNAKWDNPVLTQMVHADKIYGAGINRLGNDFLKRFRVLIDFHGGMLYLTPDPSFHEKENEWIGIGTELGLGNNHRVYITQVMIPSPANSAGLMEGDEVLTIAGKSLKELTPEAVIALIQTRKRVGEEVSLEVRHPGQKKSRGVKLQVKKLL